MCYVVIYLRTKIELSVKQGQCRMPELKLFVFFQVFLLSGLFEKPCLETELHLVNQCLRKLCADISKDVCKDTV